MDVLVKTYNESLGVVEYKKILNYQKFPHDEPWVNIKYTINKYGNKTNSIKCTLDHMFFTKDGYVKASSLKVGDNIYTIKRAWSDCDLSSILGIIIGDSHVAIDKRRNDDGALRKEVRLQLTQGAKQLDYLKEKIRLLDGNLDNIKMSKSGYCDNAIYQYAFGVDYRLTNLLYDYGCIDDGKFHITKLFVID